MESQLRISRERFDAVLFDLDGVLTPTVSVHATAWKQMFDAFLHALSSEQGTPLAPFDIIGDYKLHVDGKSRRDGVQGFLDARGLHLPVGQPDDPIERNTVYGLGNRKDELVNQVLDTDGVQAYPGSIRWVRQLRAQGFRTGVVSSSRNCRRVLQLADIEPLFDTRVDGAVAEALGLPGKPHPDMFLTAADHLATPAERAVVVEDALAGVQAGRRGRFGLIIGVARNGETAALMEAGADCVVTDLADFLEAGTPL